MCPLSEAIRHVIVCGQLSLAHFSRLKKASKTCFLKDVVFTWWFSLFSIIHYLLMSFFLSCLFSVEGVGCYLRAMVTVEQRPHNGLTIKAWSFRFGGLQHYSFLFSEEYLY